MRGLSFNGLRAVVRGALPADSYLAIIASMARPDPAELLRDARIRAGLTQRALAKRARTAQSVVARIESGATSPAWDTLSRLLAAAGFEIDATLHPIITERSHMLDDVPRILRLTPEERLLELRNVSRFVTAARRRFPKD
jgi:transcriptional regulator with XRE-family HTH domain